MTATAVPAVSRTRAPKGAGSSRGSTSGGSSALRSSGRSTSRGGGPSAGTCSSRESLSSGTATILAETGRERRPWLNGVMAGERGRRPGNPRTRELILSKAITSFVSRGYPGTTIRGVAREAAVDPALVMHFFGSKDGLFDAAVKKSLPVALLVEAVEGDEEHLAERLVTRYLHLWEDPSYGPTFAAVLHAAAATPAAADLLKDLMRKELLTPLAGSLSRDHPEIRGLFAASQMIGVAMMRYVLKVDPLASMPVHLVARTVTPGIQRYLTGALSLEEIAGAASGR
ncbi:TetR/AcrR family transcriptional regulator [Nonomuraea longispora]|uniref:TetR/AcrR family transcriptional regulator n=2 Tax=Nonomuraea longispora TaxID=1848320 RepID=A0A4R4N9P4_9ACTN|nr:TetR/AcrR family transcriptional regulator [Nonomuraea longispora]